MADKLATLFSYAGVRHDVLPGIRMAFLPVLALAIQFKTEILTFVGISNVSPTLSYTSLALVAVLGSVVLWAWAGYVLDPLYDALYGPGKPWTRSPGRKFLFFTSGYDLEKFRTIARERLTKEDRTYADSNTAIYGPVFQRLKSTDAALYESLQAELQNSKSFRNAVLPVLFLAGWFFSQGSWVPGLVATMALITLLELSFRSRASHALEAYRWLAKA